MKVAKTRADRCCCANSSVLCARVLTVQPLPMTTKSDRLNSPFTFTKEPFTARIFFASTNAKSHRLAQGYFQHLTSASCFTGCRTTGKLNLNQRLELVFKNINL